MSSPIGDKVLNRLSAQFYRWSERLDRSLYERQFRRHERREWDFIHTYTSVKELEALYNIATLQPRGANALEIGSYLGASTCYLAAGLERVSGSLFCVDTWMNQTMEDGERDTYAEFLHNTQRFRGSITPIRKRSDELEPGDIRLPLHLVFIDGDHSYEAVKRDFECVSRWVAGDGTVIFHDYGVEAYHGVSHVIVEAQASGKWKVGGVVDKLLWLNPLAVTYEVIMRVPPHASTG